MNRAVQYTELARRYAKVAEAFHMPPLPANFLQELRRTPERFVENVQRLESLPRYRQWLAQEASLDVQAWAAIDRMSEDKSQGALQGGRAAFRRLAARLHPDAGGDHDSFIRLMKAYNTSLGTERATASCG